MKRPRTYSTTLEISGVEGVPLTVTYQHVKSVTGKRDRYGLEIGPGEPERVEIDSVTLDDGREITLTTARETAMEEEIAEWLMGRFDQEPPEGHDA